MRDKNLGLASQAPLYLHSELELTETLDKGHALDVTHGAPQLYDADLGLDVVLDGLLGDSFHPLLNGVRYVRDDCK